MDLAEIYGIEVNDIFRVIDLTGVLLNGILGGKLARTKHFDAVGLSSWPSCPPWEAALCAT